MIFVFYIVFVTVVHQKNGFLWVLQYAYFYFALQAFLSIRFAQALALYMAPLSRGINLIHRGEIWRCHPQSMTRQNDRLGWMPAKRLLRNVVTMKTHSTLSQEHLYFHDWKGFYQDWCKRGLRTPLKCNFQNKYVSTLNTVDTLGNGFFSFDNWIGSSSE